MLHITCGPSLKVSSHQWMAASMGSVPGLLVWLSKWLKMVGPDCSSGKLWAFLVVFLAQTFLGKPNLGVAHNHQPVVASGQALMSLPQMPQRWSVWWHLECPSFLVTIPILPFYCANAVAILQISILFCLALQKVNLWGRFVCSWHHFSLAHVNPRAQTPYLLLHSWLLWGNHLPTTSPNGQGPTLLFWNSCQVPFCHLEISGNPIELAYVNESEN